MVARVISPRLQGILSERRERIAADLAEAGAMKTKADAAGEAYETAIAEARKRAGAIAQEARTALSTESDVRRKALEADLAAKLASAEDTIRAATASAMDNVRGIAVDAAGDIVELPDGVARRMPRPSTPPTTASGPGSPACSDPPSSGSPSPSSSSWRSLCACKTLLRGLDNRSRRIQAELDEAKRLREEASRVLADYTARPGPPTARRTPSWRPRARRPSAWPRRRTTA